MCDGGGGGVVPLPQLEMAGMSQDCDACRKHPFSLGCHCQAKSHECICCAVRLSTTLLPILRLPVSPFTVSSLPRATLRLNVVA